MSGTRGGIDRDLTCEWDKGGGIDRDLTSEWDGGDWKRPRMSNPRMSNPKMSNRVLIRTVPGESTWNVINTIILKCSSVFPLGFLAQWEVGSPFL